MSRGINDLFSVKIDGIDDNCTNRDLEEAFSKFGKVEDVYIPREFGTMRSKGFGFVRFRNEDEALDAAEARVEVAGLDVKCQLAAHGKRQMDARRGGGGRRDSRGRGRGDSRGRGGGRGRDRKDSRSRGRGGRRDSRRRR